MSRQTKEDGRKKYLKKTSMKAWPDQTKDVGNTKYGIKKTTKRPIMTRRTRTSPVQKKIQ